MAIHRNYLENFNGIYMSKENSILFLYYQINFTNWINTYLEIVRILTDGDMYEYRNLLYAIPAESRRRKPDHFVKEERTYPR